jgi:Leucine-rich repeat (LRR) protein
VDKSGEIIKSKRFTGSGPAMAYLDVALLGLLSCAPEKSNAEKIRKSVKTLNITVGSVPKLIGYDSLERLTIEFPSEAVLDKKDLSNFGVFPKLKSLKISLAGWRSETIDSLKGLVAPNLEELTASSVGLKDISALQVMKKLRVVDISSNVELKKIDALASSAQSIEDLSISYCEKVQSIDALQGATNLKKLNIDSCEKIDSLKPLSACKNFEYLSMDNIGITSLEGLESVVLKNIEVRYSFKPKNEVKLKDLISLKIPGDDQKFQISQFTIQKD